MKRPELAEHGAKINRIARVAKGKMAELAADTELFLYAGDRHLFTDCSLPSYDDQATRLVMERTLSFLARI